jgi:hypothetical protein
VTRDDADLERSVDDIVTSWRTERIERQARRHLERRDFDDLREAGLFKLPAPRAVGGFWDGAATSARRACELHRRLASGDPSVALVASMHPAVLAFWLASPDPSRPEWEEQRQAAFASAVAGEQWGTITSEPGSGGDIAPVASHYTVTMSKLRYLAPYMEWAKTRPVPEIDLAGSNILACAIEELPGARDALALDGANDNGYAPLIEAIGARYGVAPERVTTASGTSGANFLVFAALLEPGDDVLVERPGYDPLLGAAGMLGARTVRFDRVFADGFALDPDRVRAAMTPRTRLIVITTPHNPTGVAADAIALDEIGRIAESAGAHVLVDEVYKDVTGEPSPPAAARGDVFITTSSLTKSYGLSSLRAGWTIASPAISYRIRRARDIVDGTGSIVAERLAVLAFQRLDALMTRARAILARNKALADAFLASRPELEWVPSAGTIVFPRIKGLDDAMPFVERVMRERQTALGPGHFFDAPGHFRLGYGGATDTLREGLARVGDVLQRLR